MAKRAKGKAVRRAKATRSAQSRKASGRSVKRPSANVSAKRKVAGAPKRRPAAKLKAARSAPKRSKAAARSKRTTLRARRSGARRKTPRLDRVRRTLDETVPTPPSSLNMSRTASAARTGRAEMAETLEDHRGMSPDITGGDVDVDVEDAYFTGDESPGGDNPTPDQDVVDDIGKALGVQYDDAEELKSTDKIIERDRHRWEMDPASSEDYKDRK
ncbi:MAG: hypothetical protein HY655_05605 [Acidobacteria bacterium]|nr:hypothetical protein [Acidobacteriota bacterium]